MRESFKFLLLGLASATALLASSDASRTDSQLVESITNIEELSTDDTIAMRRYVYAIRDWLALSESLSVEDSYSKAKEVVTGRTAEEVARMGEIAHRLYENERLTRALEMETKTAERLLESALEGRLTDAEFAQLELDGRLVRSRITKRSTSGLPKLLFRMNKK